MRILIVEQNGELAGIWAGFLARQGLICTVVDDQEQAFEALRDFEFDAVVLDIELPGGQAIAVADYATVRDPELPIIAVNSRSFFSDSAIFEMMPNARGVLKTPLRPEDMAALVEHYGGRHDRAKVAGGGSRG